MRNFVLLSLCCFLGPGILAQQADLTVVSVQANRTTVATGERFVLSGQIRNNGPDEARDVMVTFGSNLGLFFISLVPNQTGWTCDRALSVPSAANCTRSAFGAGESTSFTAVVLAPPDVAPEGSPVTLNGIVWSSTPDPVPTNNSRMTPVTLTAAATQADLGVTIAPRDVPARPDAQTTVDVEVKNNGPSNVIDVALAIDTASREPVALVGVSPNWVCSPTAQKSTLCRTSTIAAGATSSLVLRFRTPPQDAVVALYARVQAEQNRDAVTANDFASANVHVGAEVVWRRVLLPVTAQEIPGAGGSLWRTDITMLIKSSVPVEITPGPCDTIIVTCPFVPPPLDRPFNGADFLVNASAPGGQFLYMPAPDEEKVRFNLRVYDRARIETTAGAEIPVVREDDFTAGAISLLGIPVAPQYRHTLRVYDADARAGARVLVRVYANAETTPRATVVRTLEQSPLLRPVTPAQLPSHPGYLQLDLRELASLDGLQSVRVELEPVDPGLRLWGFVSIVNNETHHVTTVTPQ